MNGPTSCVVRKIAQPETLHDDALTGERSIPVKLDAHDPIAEFAVIRRCLQERILFRSGLPKGHRIHRLCLRRLKPCHQIKRENLPRCEGFGRRETLIGSDDPS